MANCNRRANVQNRGEKENLSARFFQNVGGLGPVEPFLLGGRIQKEWIFFSLIFLEK